MMKWLLAMALAVCAAPNAAGDRQAESAFLARIERSGRLDTIGVSSSERLLPPARLAPGAPRRWRSATLRTGGATASGNST